MTQNNNGNKFISAPDTVATQVATQQSPITMVTSGTLGHAGVVNYTKAATAVVRETYVVSKK